MNDMDIKITNRSFIEAVERCAKIKEMSVSKIFNIIGLEEVPFRLNQIHITDYHLISFSEVMEVPFGFIYLLCLDGAAVSEEVMLLKGSLYSILESLYSYNNDIYMNFLWKYDHTGLQKEDKDILNRDIDTALERSYLADICRVYNSVLNMAENGDL